MKNNSCNPCEGCSEIVSSDCISVQSSISCIDMSIGDNLTDVLNALGSQLCNFYNIIDGGSGLTVEEVDGTPSYTAINTLRFNQDSGFIVTQPGTNIADVRLIPTFLFPDGTYITVDMVTSGNITLSGLQNLDSQTGIVGSRVLVWKQSTKSQNGVYVQAVGAWTRATDSDTSAELNNQVVFANYAKAGTTYGGNYFNQIALSPTIGADNIIYQKGILGGNKQAWLLNGNDLEGVEKYIGTISNDDFSIRTNDIEKARVFKTGEIGINISTSPLARLHVKGSGTTSSTYNFFTESNDGYSLAHDDDGQIYRTGQLWSKATSVGQGLTTWGESAGISSSTANHATMIGFQAGVSLVSGNGFTAVGSGALYLATVSSNTGIGASAGRNHTTGHSCTYLGFSAGYPAGVGDNSTGSYSTAIGTYAMIGGNFDNVLSICGVGTASNQIVIGGATNINNAALCYYDDMYIGKGVTHLTPGDIKIQGTGGAGTNIDGGDLILASARATGDGDSGDIIAKYAPPGASGTTLTTLTTGLTFKGTNGGLELSSTLGYLLLNRLTTAQKNALTAVNGMVVYDSTLNKFQGYENGVWTSFI
jgi:hypothetical protein